MVGDIKAISPCVKSASAKLFLDLHTVSAPSGEERTLDTSAQVERTGQCCRRSDSGTHAWCGHATVMVLLLVSQHISLRAARAAASALRGTLIRTPYFLGSYFLGGQIDSVKY